MSLTETDRAILSLLASGVTVVRIAEIHHYSREAINHRLRKLRDKYDATNNTALVARALREGLIE